MSPGPVRLTQPKRVDRSSPEATGLPTNGTTQKPAPPYVFFHLPQSWYWTEKLDDDGKRYGWLPRPKKAPAVPGVNGVQDPGKGPVQLAHMAPMFARIAAKGGRLIQSEDPRLGDYRGYDACYDTQDGRQWFVEPGQEAAVLPNGRILWNMDEGGKEAMRFHRFLKSTDLVYPLMREFYAGFMALERDTLSRLTQAAGVTPGLMYKVEAQEAKMKLMEEDFEAMYPPEAAVKPTRKRANLGSAVTE